MTLPAASNVQPMPLVSLTALEPKAKSSSLFVTPDGDVWGRPVGVAVAKDGSLMVTDDGSGTVWRVAYVGKTRTP